MNHIEKQKRVDPDPVTVGVSILSVLANVTTVFLYLDGLRHQRLVERRQKIRIRTRNAIRRLRNDLTHLRASADNVFSLTPRDSRESPFRFGYAPVFLDRMEFDIYQDEYAEILWRIGEIQGRARRILTDIFDWPDGVVDLPTGALREANSAANRIFEERLTVAEAYATIRKLIDTMTQQLEDIDDYLSQFGVE
jgi:hypothetical protein